MEAGEVGSEGEAGPGRVLPAPGLLGGQQPVAEAVVGRPAVLTRRAVVPPVLWYNDAKWGGYGEIQYSQIESSRATLG